MTKKPAKKEERSLKMVILYATIVAILVFASLAYKAFLIVQRSKFDGQHQFTFAIAKDNKVAEIVSINPSTAYLSILRLKNASVPLSSIGAALRLAVDAKINTTANIPTDDIATTMQSLLFRDTLVDKSMTVYDLARLTLIARNTPAGNKKIKEITLPMNQKRLDDIIVLLFTDNTIASENVGIQIVNASDISGLGARLAKVLTNMGANVIDITTAHEVVAHSNIQYYGKETYTLQKLQRILQYPVKKLKKETIGDIVITIGKDNNDTSIF